MKSIELRRHAEKDPKGLLTEAGTQAAIALGEKLPVFSQIISSDSDRAKVTAKLISGTEPVTDERASMYMLTSEKSAEINDLATKNDVTFLEALYTDNAPETVANVNQRAEDFNALIDEVFNNLEADEHGLIISHDLSISAALAKRGIPIEPIAPLEGYIVYENGDIISLANE